MTIDLKDITFTIPFRYDSEERLRNIRTVIAYLTKYFDTNIHVMEESHERRFTDVGPFQYTFIQTNDPFMHRTRCLNLMAKQATTPFIANYDTDVLMPTRQYIESIFLLRQNAYDMVFPYSGKFINYISPQLDTIIHNCSLDGISEESGHIIHPNSVGGAIFWNKQKFIEGGMENENFKSWGFEDNERLVRFTRMGLRIHRVPGSVFHMNHPPSMNSANTSTEQYQRNSAEFSKVNGMDQGMIKNYMKSWPWLR
jgi:predicted glycosyltransferase involved in capsule biosynthesis